MRLIDFNNTTTDNNNCIIYLRLKYANELFTNFKVEIITDSYTFGIIMKPNMIFWNKWRVHNKPTQLKKISAIK